MKRALTLMITTFSIAAVMVACGQSGGGGTSTPVVVPTPVPVAGPYGGGAYGGGPYGAGGCGPGSIYTQYGCLAQGGCQYGMASYNGTCIAATMGGGAYGGGAGPYGGGAYGGGAGPYGGGAYGGGVCGPGSTYLANIGCVPQGSCAYSQAFYNGVCVQGMAVNPVSGFGGGGYPYTQNPYPQNPYGGGNGYFWYRY